MAKSFLEQLPKIPGDELPKDSSCMICRREYGSDPLDVAVRLPCNHHVGFECISIWLSPERDKKNSCPLCRSIFFEVIDEEDEELYYRAIITRVGRDPPEQYPGDNSLTWYGYFIEAAAEQYEESFTRARAFSAINDPTWDEAQIGGLAEAYRTLAVREVLLYLKFSREGASLPPLLGMISGPLNAEQSETLLQVLQLRNAFEEDSQLSRFRDLTDREKLLLHREQGESYWPFEGGFWGW